MFDKFGRTDMTMMPMFKICPVCRKGYCWNPDAGINICPNCIKKLGKYTWELLGKILKK